MVEKHDPPVACVCMPCMYKYNVATQERWGARRLRSHETPRPCPSISPEGPGISSLGRSQPVGRYYSSTSSSTSRTDRSTGRQVSTGGTSIQQAVDLPQVQADLRQQRDSRATPHQTRPWTQTNSGLLSIVWRRRLPRPDRCPPTPCDPMPRPPLWHNTYRTKLRVLRCESPALLVECLFVCGSVVLVYGALV